MPNRKHKMLPRKFILFVNLVVLLSGFTELVRAMDFGETEKSKKIPFIKKRVVLKFYLSGLSDETNMKTGLVYGKALGNSHDDEYRVFLKKDF